jgi:glycosyltransferase involved in cell wall biosynthesis
MEERKGVRVILQAAAELVNVRRRRDVHFLICGNREGEKERFDGLYRQSPAEAHITFGGYRRDIPELLPGCYAGIIASTGWDSHTLSAVEMAACGLPLLVSDLGGLKEAVVEGKTGYLFPVGDYLELADRIDDLVASPAARHTLSNNAVERARRCYSRETQKKELLRILATHCS